MRPWVARWTRAVSLRFLLWVMVAAFAFGGSGCVYFNTFYHAKKFFSQGEQMRKKSGRRSGITPGKNYYENAIEKASKIVEKHPKSKYHDDALFLIGVSYFHIGNFTKAENAFRELLATHPDSKFVEESQLYLARCRIELGDERAGFRVFTELAKTARKSEWRAEAIFQRGEFFFKNEEYDSARTEFEQVLTEYTKSDRALDSRLRAAQSLRQLGRYDESIELYRPLLEKEESPNVQFEALQGIGESFYESKRPDSGVAIFSAMVDDDRFEDSIGTTRLELARGLQDLGDYEGAWRQYEQVTAALERTRWSAEAYFRMAEIKQFQEDDLIGAKDLYDQSRLESPTGRLSQEALTRSANITTLEQFRKELGRGELSRGKRIGETAIQAYDPARLPRLEREITYSPPEARPPDFGKVSDTLDSTAVVLGPPTLTEAEQAAADSAFVADSLAEVFGPPTELAPFLGPPVDSSDIAWDRKHNVLLPEKIWQSLVEVDSALGPPSPAYRYAFGTKNLQGPVTPEDSVLQRWAFVDVDTAAERIKAERETARAERKARLEEIGASAKVQFQLAELYRFSLFHPDSALKEYETIVERYPETPYAAKALLAAADVLEADLKDTSAAEEHLQHILRDYPYSDYAGEAIARLGLQGTDADTAYPALFYRQAENAFLESGDPKRAIRELRSFIDRYPDSRLVANAEFAIISLKEQYFPPGDSSLLVAYQEIEKDDPNTPFAKAAAEKLTFTVERPKRRQRNVVAEADVLAAGGTAGTPDSTKDSTLAGITLPLAPRPDKRGEFVFPESEIGSFTQKSRVVYKILIDFTGAIADYEVLQETPSTDINENARIALLQTTFNPDSIALDSLNMWYRYDISVDPPARERNEFDRFGIPVNPADRNQNNQNNGNRP